MYWLYNLCLFGSCATLQHPYSVVETGRVFELIAEAKGELAPNHRASVILQQVGRILSSLGKPEKRPPPPLLSCRLAPRVAAAALMQTRNIHYPGLWCISTATATALTMPSFLEPSSAEKASRGCLHETLWREEVADRNCDLTIAISWKICGRLKSRS